MKKPFVKGGKALTLAAALLCGAAFLGSFTAFGAAAQAESQAGAQAEATTAASPIDAAAAASPIVFPIMKFFSISTPV